MSGTAASLVKRLLWPVCATAVAIALGWASGDYRGTPHLLVIMLLWSTVEVVMWKREKR